MKEILNEYGSVIVGAAAAVLILLLVISLVFGGDIFDAILNFSRSIC